MTIFDTVTDGADLLLLLVLGVGIVILFTNWVSDFLAQVVRAPTCPDCGHPASFHEGPHCRGTAEHPTGHAQSWRPGMRCPCTLSRPELKKPKRGKTPET
jgi:hypothetical protein